MGPYSLDLRQRIAAAIDAHEGSQPEIARRFRVSVSFITRLLRRRHRTGSLAPKPHGGGHPPALDRSGRPEIGSQVSAPITKYAASVMFVSAQIFNATGRRFGECS
jgi:transposase